VAIGGLAAASTHVDDARKQRYERRLPTATSIVTIAIAIAITIIMIIMIIIVVINIMTAIADAAAINPLWTST
jgi:hypothetical protein